MRYHLLITLTALLVKSLASSGEQLRALCGLDIKTTIHFYLRMITESQTTQTTIKLPKFVLSASLARGSSMSDGRHQAQAKSESRPIIPQCPVCPDSFWCFC